MFHSLQPTSTWGRAGVGTHEQDARSDRPVRIGMGGLIFIHPSEPELSEFNSKIQYNVACWV